MSCLIEELVKEKLVLGWHELYPKFILNMEQFGYFEP